MLRLQRRRHGSCVRVACWLMRRGRRARQLSQLSQLFAGTTHWLRPPSLAAANFSLMVHVRVEPAALAGTTRPRVAVSGAFAVKEALKGCGYVWDTASKSWWKFLTDDTLRELKARARRDWRRTRQMWRLQRGDTAAQRRKCLRSSAATRASAPLVVVGTPSALRLCARAVALTTLTRRAARGDAPRRSSRRARAFSCRGWTRRCVLPQRAP